MTDPLVEARTLLSRLAAAENAIKRDNEGAAAAYIEAKASLGSPALVEALCVRLEALGPLAKAADRFSVAQRVYDATPRIEDDIDPCDPREAGLPSAADEPAAELARAGQALIETARSFR